MALCPFYHSALSLQKISQNRLVQVQVLSTKAQLSEVWGFTLHTEIWSTTTHQKRTADLATCWVPKPPPRVWFNEQELYTGLICYCQAPLLWVSDKVTVISSWAACQSYIYTTHYDVCESFRSALTWARGSCCFHKTGEAPGGCLPVHTWGILHWHTYSTQANIKYNTWKLIFAVTTVVVKFICHQTGPLNLKMWVMHYYFCIFLNHPFCSNSYVCASISKSK